MSKRKLREKTKHFVTDHLPVGYEPAKERMTFLTALICPTLFSFIFLAAYSTERNSLFRYIGASLRKELIPGAVMKDFVDVLGYSMAAFPVFALVCLISQLISHYAYHRTGSNAFYTMCRLPDSHELRRRCMTLPLMETAVILLVMALVFAIYYLIYMWATPEECLRPGQWSLIWEKWRVF